MKTLPEEHIVQATINASIASAEFFGKGLQDPADEAASNAIRRCLNSAPYNFKVVMGEGERDNAPLIKSGEQMGKYRTVNSNMENLVDISKIQQVDIAVDPLEGTGICSRGLGGAMSVIAASEKAGMLQAPDLYMEKIALSVDDDDLKKNLEHNLKLDLTLSISENLEHIAKAKNCRIEELKIVMLDRPRHKKILDSLRKNNVCVTLIADGDIEAVIHTTKIPKILGIDSTKNFDAYVGIGGAPEGVLAAALLRCCAGSMISKLIFRNDGEKSRAKACGISDFSKIYGIKDLVPSDNVIFAATGVSSGNLLKGVQYNIREKAYLTNSLVVSKNSPKNLLDNSLSNSSGNLRAKIITQLTYRQD